jgi:hypothetical protein
MRVLGEISPKVLPRPIPADELQVMIGPNQAFCSWDASILKVGEEMARWPFLSLGIRSQPEIKQRPQPLKITKGAAPPLRH